MKKTLIILCGLIICFVFLKACSKWYPEMPDANEILDGQVEGLNYEQHIQFLAGDAAFNNDIFSLENGLGPSFVATSCGSCHPGDGKGHPFTTLTRFGQTDSTGNKFLNQGGPQLQNRAIPGFQPEQIPESATYSKFTPPANTGLGFLDAVPDATLLTLADPNDTNGDGISGVPNWIMIPAYSTLRPASIVRYDGNYIGRFGKKASTYDLLQQTATAYNQDIGITSSFVPVDVYSGKISDPEVSDRTVHNVVFYLKTLKAPIQRTPDNADILEGKNLFTNAGCIKCHVPELTTGYSPIQALSYKTFFPYTDLLLHDMGPGLDDGYTEGTAKTSEWRTPPLWGLGLSKNSQGRQYFLLHDGRANSIEDAILLHYGEGGAAQNYYQSLSPEEKQKLIRFLESL